MLQLAQIADDATPATPASRMVKVDRIDDKGNIREHLTLDGSRTICGIEIGYRQTPCGNATCRRCEKIATRLSEVAVCDVKETP